MLTTSFPNEVTLVNKHSLIMGILNELRRYNLDSYHKAELATQQVYVTHQFQLVKLALPPEQGKFGQETVHLPLP